VIDLEPRVTLRPYTTLVVKDFQNAVGDALPQAVLQKLPEVVIAHLKECYPSAFAKFERTASGSTEELVLEGSVTGYEEGSWLVLVFTGEMPFRLISTVSLADGKTNRKLKEVKVDLGWHSPPVFFGPIAAPPGAAALAAAGAVEAGLMGVADLIDEVEVQIAIALADQKGHFILRRQELAAPPLVSPATSQGRDRRPSTSRRAPPREGSLLHEGITEARGPSVELGGN
jgi:hypothetical protein